jgi:RNA polymerase sigma factor (sigma-70 family)
VLHGDDITRLYDRHAKALLGFFARRTFQPDVAVDLVAETFASAFADRARFRGGGEEVEAAWLYGIARHRLAEWRRRGSVERRALARLGVDLRPLTDAEYDRIEELAGLAALRIRVQQGLAELSSEHRDALRLRVVEEREYADVAVALGISEQTARARVSRALGALRRSGALIDLTEEPEHA